MWPEEGDTENPLGIEQGMHLGRGGIHLRRLHPPRSPFKDPCPFLGAPSGCGGCPRAGASVGVQPTALAERWTDSSIFLS